jgi:predicted nucleotidyltransferase
VTRLEVFGSAARGTDFDPSRSDADFLVTFDPVATYDLAAFVDLKGALEGLLRRPVDLVEREAHRGEPKFHSAPGDPERSRNGLCAFASSEAARSRAGVQAPRLAVSFTLRVWTRNLVDLSVR